MRIGWCTSTSTRRGARSTRRLSSQCASSATRNGSPACIPTSRRPKSSTIPIPTPNGMPARPNGSGAELSSEEEEEEKAVSTTTEVGGRERLARVVPDAIAAIHEVLARHQVTEDEWYAALEFLTQVGQPDFNFRGRFGVAQSGDYEFQTMIPKPYTVPTDGPVGRSLDAMGQHPWRPAHIHFKVTAEGHEPLVTQLFFAGDPYLENDTIGAVKQALVRSPEKHGDVAELRERGLDAAFFTCDFDIRLRPLGA